MGKTYERFLVVSDARNKFKIQNRTCSEYQIIPRVILSKYEEGYKPSDAVIKAQEYLNKVSEEKPSPFVSSYKEQLEDIYNKIMNRKEFSYDLNGDMLYQQMKDQYQVLGKTAMQDTMGEAAALTGGYGNTYAQSVGQQTYDEYLRQLNDNIPDLYQLALQQYNSRRRAYVTTVRAYGRYV